MNKTTHKKVYSRNKEILTQSDFRKQRPYSPIKSQKSTDDSPQTQKNIGSQYPITCTNWCIFDTKNKYFKGVRQDHQREIASLTKIMTTIVCIELFERYHLEKNVLIRVSSTAASHIGTTANLRVGKYVQLYDLLYGAMLPSGNDAAYLLAEIFGLLLFYESVKPESKDYSQIESIDLTCYQTTTTFMNRFLKQMNKKAKDLKMNRTVFTNPHGLPNILNVSSAKDILLLSRYCYKNEAFKQIMNREEYKATFYEEDMKKIHCHQKWENTNKLLGLGWEGIKTGQTYPAGACLSSVRDGIFIVTLNCSNRESRFEDTIMLWEWYRSNKTNSNDQE